LQQRQLDALVTPGRLAASPLRCGRPDALSMRLVVTFTHPEHAHDFVRALRHRRARNVSRTTDGTDGESRHYDLVAAWVEDVDEEEARQLAVETGGFVRDAAPEDTPTV
jgi:hypothetical protein